MLPFVSVGVFFLLSSPFVRGQYAVNTTYEPEQFRFTRDGHVFFSIVTESTIYTPGSRPSRILALRPRPNHDPNGWGTSIYMQPFFPAARLDYTGEVEATAEEDGVHVKAVGGVSEGDANAPGNWSLNGTFSFDDESRVVKGVGTYSIRLFEPLSELDGDLNLMKLASNYLLDVPLLSGGRGDTGDMTQVEVTASNFHINWSPPTRPSFYPSESASRLLMNMTGDFYDLDSTEWDGFEGRIAAACKPSVEFLLDCSKEVRFGALYDTTVARLYWMDNIGVTPLLHSDTHPDTKNVDCTFEFASRAYLGGDCK
uniref:Uncharacterized protein n=1 Tax=Chromera velia CCMP2878 TaxID=1169474 RepID=A0A0G4I5F3_9ALVE|eukprot:Cvel_36096.t1-p1 / transcript=Cvel_36096.t1 / gene=Cvel_36096 / organism=Chromera_velia_CCMP2878 / gene_product=hypothetical protein / transcript_product=hypothetical protein / location=Cvel_scaffold6933:584-1937(-) / protein_length=311 / sequence_SO=supercontig / SO=protein_coding / is_pseudo=false